MDGIFFEILISTSIISLISLIGIVAFSFSDKFLSKILLYLVSLSAGALLGGALFHLIPEALELGNIDILIIMIFIFIGFVIFFIIEKILQWRHCHKTDCDIHSQETFGYMNLIGDGFHNLIDGFVIAASFLTNTTLGISTILAIFLHELPQEIGDYGVLLHSGMEKKRALLLNLFSASVIIIGGIVGYFLLNSFIEIRGYLLPFAAGGFLYISLSDLIPEIRRENNMKSWLLYFFVFLFGSVIMLVLTLF